MTQHILKQTPINIKKHKETAKIGAKIYDEQLRKEIDEDRKSRGKKPFKDNNDYDDNTPSSGASGATREITVSNTDPDSGIFRKGDHKVEFAYTTHTACDRNGFVLGNVTTDRNGYRQYESNPIICSSCPHLKKCTHSLNHQKVAIKHIWQNYIERAEDFRHSSLGKTTYALRSQTIERVFADAKEKHAMRYTPYRGIKRVSGWITLKFGCMNLKKMALWA